MPTKSLFQQLRDELDSFQDQDVSEALSLLDAIENEHEEYKEEIEDLKEENDNLQDEIDNYPSLTSVNLGLDTIHYYLEKGNLNIQQQINSAFNTIQPNAILY